MMSFKHSLLALGVASTFILTGCGGGGGGPGEPRLNVPQDPTRDQTEQQGFCDSSTTAFSVTEFVPVGGATDVAVNTNVRITFNANVDAESVPGNVRLLIDGANAVALEEGSPRVLGSSIILNPLGDLAAESSFTIEADSGLRADCPEPNTKTLGSQNTSTFTTGLADNLDETGPTIVAADPENGESLAPRNTRIFVQFDEPIDPSTVNADNFVVTQLDTNGNPVGTVSGAINPVGNSIEFTPDGDLAGQTFFRVNVGTSIEDLAGNDLTEAGEFTFRTGGLVLALNDGVVDQIPGLGDGLNALVGTLLDPLAFGDSEDGLSSLDNAVILQIPLIDGLQNLDQLGTLPTTSVNGTDFTEFTSALVAVCDPKSVTSSSDGTGGIDVDCALSLDLGLDITQLASLADAFTGGNPEQVPDLLLTFLEGLGSGDLSAVPPEFAQLFVQGDGLGIDLSLLEDGSIPLPAPLENGLVELLDTLGQLPVLGTLVSQTDNKELVNLRLLEGELLGVSAGDLLSIGVLEGFETFVGPNGVLNLGGAAFDALLGLSPIGGGDGTPSPEDLPLIGDLLSFLDAENFFDGGFDPNNLPIIGDLASLLDIGGDFGGGDIPVLGELLSLLDPRTITDGNLPIIGDLFEQLLALGQGDETPLDSLPLVGDLLGLLQGGAADSPLGDILDPSALEAIPVIGTPLSGLLGGLLGGITG
ncbi:Ig-like domain-containing protein [Marinobacter sp. NSM]|uniref:Ig-like domain-containing protein n=1 Tax=Marinobacter sp. NSM TaxID=3458004 RepID=UPI0040368E1B